MCRFIILAIAGLAAACADRSVAVVDVDQSRESRVEMTVDANRDLDILFVVDNSNSMAREQERLAENFPRLIGILENHPDGLPSVHIGVVSTDMGTTEPAGGCSSLGDAGRFLGRDCGLDGAFIRDIAHEGGDREQNYSGTLSETFSCMALLGTDGCGYEQPLSAMKRALESPDGRDFLRDDAYLVVVLITDEDDCSASDPQLFSSDQVALDSELGPPTSYRCFEFGVECDGPMPRDPGVRQNCTPRVGSPYMHGVSEYVRFLKNLKQHPGQLIVTAIAGELGPVVVNEVHDDRLDMTVPRLAYSCNEPNAEAVPPIRIAALLSEFPQTSTLTSICEPDLSGALTQIADLIVESHEACIEGPLADSDPDTPGLQPDCIVTEFELDRRSERRLPACDRPEDPNSSSNLPCYVLAESELCDTETGLSPTVHYGEGVTVPFGTTAEMRCRAP